VRNDLWDGVADVIARSRPDHVVLETTGIAQPAAVLEGLDEARLRAAGVVCVVDADAGAAQLDERPEARAQVEAADRIMLSKLDVATPSAVAAVHARLDPIAGDAERAAFPHTAEGTAALVSWVLEVRAAGRAPRAHGHAAHQHQLVAATFVDDAPLLEAQLVAVLEQLRDRLVRVKGFVHLAGRSRRGFVELAGATLEVRDGEPWADAPRRSELVLIGDGIDEATVRRRLWSCRAA